jgi:uncharacterized protein (TIGR02284 family)
MAFDIDKLNSCLRGELAAIETYRQGLDKIRADFGSDPKFQQLTQMLRDHEQAATELQSLVQQCGGTPDDDSGAWGTWANTVMGSARLLGDRAALKALKEGEESGGKQYQDLLDDTDAPTNVRTVVTKLLQRCREHVAQLDRMTETAEAV